MIRFKNKFYFLKPVDLTEFDTEFEVYSAQGLFMGTTVRGINPLFFETEEERVVFEEYMLDETMKIQAQVKFLEEYQTTIDEFKSLTQDVESICENMDFKWAIPKGEMKKLLASSY